MANGVTDRRSQQPSDAPERAHHSPGVERRHTLAGLDAPKRRRTDFIARYRQPILGLGLLGAAAPLARQAVRIEGESASAEAVPATVPTAPDTAAASAIDAEEGLAERIAVSREQAERATYISTAISLHGITEELAADIFDIARQEGVDPDVALGLVRTESTFDERAVSPVGARGLTQVMPRTARGIIPGTRDEQLFDRRTNLRLGFRYLDQMVQKYRGNLELALTAYNRGPGTVDRVLKRGGNPDNGYAGKVLGS